MPSRAVPILASADLTATLAFYEALGFANLGAPPEEWDYLIVGRHGAELHFLGPSPGTRAPGTCFIYVEDADAVHEQWLGRVVPPARMDAPVSQDYGMRTFTLVDPNLNEVRVGSPS
jgi:hypothetical protein